MSLADDVAKRLKARNQTLSFAESCTGGLLSARLAALPGVSKIYMGSVVAYSNQVKESCLEVPRTLLLAMGAVSLPVALKMANGARKILRTTWSVSVTGIAGPDGGTPDKPVGTVCFGVCGPGIEYAEQCHFGGERSDIQSAAADHALRLLLKHIA